MKLNICTKFFLQIYLLTILDFLRQLCNKGLKFSWIVPVIFLRDETLVNTELASKLEPAFLSGLRCIQPQIRSRFMEVRPKKKGSVFCVDSRIFRNTLCFHDLRRIYWFTITIIPLSIPFVNLWVRFSHLWQTLEHSNFNFSRIRRLRVNTDRISRSCFHTGSFAVNHSGPC